MTNQVVPTDLFETKFKRLKKKFRTLNDEMKELTSVLEQTPTSGESLGSGLYKIRLASKSKGKGKSGGFRVITYLLAKTEDGIDVYLLTIYDKSEESSIKKETLLALAKALLDQQAAVISSCKTLPCSEPSSSLPCSQLHFS